MGEFWNQRFAEPGYKYGTAPNAWLQQQAYRLGTHSQVLVPGDGEGRNGVWLAEQGHQVLSVDYAEVGLAKTQALAVQRGVADRLRTAWVDLSDWAPDPGSADAVVLVFVHLPTSFRAAAHRRVAAALRPGGWLILEAFHPEQLALHSGGPRDPDMLYALQQLREDFAGLLTEVVGEESTVVLDEGPGHQGPGRVTRWVGRR